MNYNAYDDVHDESLHDWLDERELYADEPSPDEYREDDERALDALDYREHILGSHFDKEDIPF